MIPFIARQLRRLTALVALTALLVGAPWALYQLGMPFLPDHVPSGAEIWDTLTERDTGQVFLGTLVVIGFAAWAIFAASLLADIAARITRRRSVWNADPAATQRRCHRDHDAARRNARPHSCANRHCIDETVRGGP